MSSTQCRTLIGGFGKPGMRDLDFGRVVIDWLQQLDWPAGVVLEDLSCSAPLVLDRLQELQPAKVVLVGAVGRELDPPGTIRRYAVDLTPPRPAEVHRSVEEAVMGVVDLDHTLAMARHWGGLPADTVVIEVEPAEASFGLGFSDVLAECLDRLLEEICKELGLPGRPAASPDSWPADPTPADATPVEPSGALDELQTYAHQHAAARRQRSRAPSLVDRVSAEVPGIALAGRLQPWGVFVDNGGDWFDAVPLGDGAVGLVIGDVPGRGVEAASAMGDLRAAVRAYVVRDGGSPAALLGHLDRLAQATGLGDEARLVYLTLQPATGELRYADAGGCPPLVVEAGGGGARFAETIGGPPLGTFPGVVRHQAAVRLEPGSTLLLFTDGLVQSRAVARPAGLERLRRAAASGPDGLDDLCGHVLTACTRKLDRDDDICLLGVRLQAHAVPAQAQPTRGHAT